MVPAAGEGWRNFGRAPAPAGSAPVYAIRSG